MLCTSIYGSGDTRLVRDHNISLKPRPCLGHIIEILAATEEFVNHRSDFKTKLYVMIPQYIQNDSTGFNGDRQRAGCVTHVLNQ